MTQPSCDLTVFTPAQRAAHHAAQLAVVLGRSVGRRVVDDGVELEYPVDGGLAAALLAWVVDERRCCPFIRFELALDPAADRMRLAMTGPRGTREILLSAFAA
jgi:hypothetical protein